MNEENKKYVLTDEKKVFYARKFWGFDDYISRGYTLKITVYRIQAVRTFGKVKKGDLGGWVSDERNLSHEGNCWIGDNAIVCDWAEVTDNAQVSGNAFANVQTHIGDDAIVTDCACVLGHASARGHAKVSGNAILHGFFGAKNNDQIHHGLHGDHMYDE